VRGEGGIIESPLPGGALKEKLTLLTWFNEKNQMEVKNG